MPTVDSFNVDHDLEFITQDMIPFDAYHCGKERD